ncbi:LamG-like jellyroll fold domain-containing protein [Mariniphaga sediminis]|uniref:LamG-like jellyroll fold domain-containing protein n=1 Tax=Mariniphaga sediminis TaxID=1628158 RepID=UPI00356ABB72
MKTIKYLFTIFLISIFAVACEKDYIDPISRVEPGEDKTAPTARITNPTDDVIIPFTDEETSLNIQFEVEDDIEIASVSVSLDGSQLATYNNFKDYRRFLESFLAKNVPIGEHTITVTATDLAGKEITETFTFEVSNKYIAKYEGETFFMPFEGELYMELLSETEATVEGEPGFAGGKSGEAYAGAADAYLTFPTEGLQGEEFSAAFWYKLKLSDPEPDYGQRAGILVMGPPDPLNPLAQNNRKAGFRFFRENAGGKQRIKLNVGNGTADSWFDGGAAADIDPAAGEWVHLAFTISSTECVVYINGEVVKQGAFEGVDWTGCDMLSVMSGAPRFNGWNHWSDESLIDELRLFSKALTQEEINNMIN